LGAGISWGPRKAGPCCWRGSKLSQVFHDHFSCVAGSYSAYRPHYPAELFDYLAKLVPREATVWDCAAGNGQATVDLAERFGRVIATDGSAQQISSATAHLGAEYRVAVAEASGLADQSVDLITVAQALHWFDLDRFFAEVRRVLKPGGVLAVWAYGTNEVEGEEVNRLVQDYYSNVVGPYWPPERVLVENGYETITLPYPEISVPAFRMETSWNLEELLGYFSTWSATNRYIKANARNPLEPLAETLAEVWGDANTRKLVVWPLVVKMAKKPSSNQTS